MGVACASGQGSKACRSHSDCAEGQICVGGNCVRQRDAGSDGFIEFPDAQDAAPLVVADGWQGDGANNDAWSPETDAHTQDAPPSVDAFSRDAFTPQDAFMARPDAWMPDAANPCGDGRMGPGESDIDCGGICPPCPNGRMCRAPSDCLSSTCMGGRCVTCTTPRWVMVSDSCPSSPPLASTRLQGIELVGSNQIRVHFSLSVGECSKTLMLEGASISGTAGGCTTPIFDIQVPSPTEIHLIRSECVDRGWLSGATWVLSHGCTEPDGNIYQLTLETPQRLVFHRSVCPPGLASCRLCTIALTLMGLCSP
ncbi:MAG: hypothetical protein NZM37_02625 [Sandaracinaceae bacterium]|nr:hypothetical protein [Sandaracinaceae bacterium]